MLLRHPVARFQSCRLESILWQHLQLTAIRSILLPVVRDRCISSCRMWCVMRRWHITGEDGGPRRCVPAVDGARRPAAHSPAGGAAGLGAGGVAAGCGATSPAARRAAGRPGPGHARCDAVRLLQCAPHMQCDIVLAAASEGKHLLPPSWSLRSGVSMHGTSCCKGVSCAAVDSIHRGTCVHRE